VAEFSNAVENVVSIVEAFGSVMQLLVYGVVCLNSLL
jgi:hypothetical protein